MKYQIPSKSIEETVLNELAPTLKVFNDLDAKNNEFRLFLRIEILSDFCQHSIPTWKTWRGESDKTKRRADLKAWSPIIKEVNEDNPEKSARRTPTKLYLVALSPIEIVCKAPLPAREKEVIELPTLSSITTLLRKDKAIRWKEERLKNTSNSKCFWFTIRINRKRR